MCGASPRRREVRTWNAEARARVRGVVQPAGSACGRRAREVRAFQPRDARACGAVGGARARRGGPVVGKPFYETGAGGRGDGGKVKRM